MSVYDVPMPTNNGHPAQMPYVYFSIAPDLRGNLTANLGTYDLFGTDRHVRSHVRQPLDLHVEDLDGLGAGDRYRRISMAIWSALSANLPPSALENPTE